uniref:Uncharacterized protein n=1 Tax=Brassica campestris TaxID=3711 RepID=A0A3P6DDA4_BRACM|nr:unnamed protein product [Brassica rapa]
MRKKKLVRLEMVRRSLRMRADIRIMKHLVTRDARLIPWSFSCRHSSSLQLGVFRFFFGRFISQYEDHKLSGVGANNLLSLNPPADTRNESGSVDDVNARDVAVGCSIAKLFALLKFWIIF